jgi:lycopene cyclase domain-containing protein
VSATYALLDLAFLAVVAVVGIVAAVVAGRRAAGRGGRAAVTRWRRTTLVTGLVVGAVLLVMTIVFDNVIVGLRIVAYDPALISGARIGAIPVEDLGYAIGAVVLLPSLWVLFARSDRRARAVTPAHGSRPEAGASRGPAASGTERER